ncbi:MAG TPA: sensor histidine kinase, partial [Draconibacterium sp.]|nr:sensor histidine kinase [Draconibacterium sp.]
ISDRKKAEEKQQKYKDELKLLSTELINTQENEKKMLAQELHDEIGQLLTAMKINLSSVKNKLPKNYNLKTKQQVDETDKILDNIISQVHELSLNLRPELLDVLGLSATLQAYCKQFSERIDINVIFKPNDTKINLPKEYEINIFRIVQEALTNVARHSGAKNVRIDFNVDKNGWLKLAIEDDGRGFNTENYNNPEEKTVGIGLLGMRERVNLMKGKMKITSLKGEGTTINIQIPLTK